MKNIIKCAAIVALLASPFLAADDVTIVNKSGEPVYVAMVLVEKPSEQDVLSNPLWYLKEIAKVKKATQSSNVQLRRIHKAKGRVFAKVLGNLNELTVLENGKSITLAQVPCDISSSHCNNYLIASSKAQLLHDALTQDHENIEVFIFYQRESMAGKDISDRNRYYDSKLIEITSGKANKLRIDDKSYTRRNIKVAKEGFPDVTASKKITDLTA